MRREGGGDLTISLQGLRILVAEDDDRVARLLVDMVELHGGAVAGPAGSEDEAWTLLDAAPVDGAILDVRLRSTTSLSLAGELTRRRIPVILTTGHARSEIPAPYADLPIFTKPFHLSALMECLSDGCRSRPVPPASID
jgi:DNA-binding NtrC family response regulator